jgi:hypothetical protein
MKAFLTKKPTVFGIFILLTILLSSQKISLGKKEISGVMATHYNNFIIFKNASFHLQNHQNLYDWYKLEQWDQYKYTPTFATFFTIFTYSDNFLGGNLWNLLNLLVLLLGIYSLPNRLLDTKAKISFFVLLELITSLQSFQTNALNVGLLLLFFSKMEKKHYFWAMFFLVCTFYSKMYGITAGIIWFFYDEKIKTLAYGLFWFLVLAAVPLLQVSFEDLIWHYQNYWTLIKEDHAVSFGLSFVNLVNKWFGEGFLQQGFGLNFNKLAIMLTGLFLTISPLVLVKKYKNEVFRTIFLGNFMICLIIFNEKAESPTFILAAVGVALWYFSQKTTRLNFALLIGSILFSWLAASDIYPKYVRIHFFEAYCIKVLPCFLIWIKALYDLYFVIGEEREEIA